MEDQKIVSLFWARSEAAIREAAGKYGRYCRYIAFHILRSAEDSEECVSDTYLRAWNSMPPQRPRVLKAFLGRITRNLSLDRYDRLEAQKRGGGEAPLVLDELRDVLRAGEDAESAWDERALKEVIHRFLCGVSREQRMMFVRRYWYLCSVKEIARDMGFSESKVKTALMRLRQALKRALEEEGIII